LNGPTSLPLATLDEKELKEAAALLDALPAAMQPYRTVRLWRARIAQGTGVARMPAAGAAVVTAAN